MIRLHLQVNLAYTVQTPGADFFFYIHAARTRHQHVPEETLRITPDSSEWQVQPSPNSGERCLRLRARPGALQVQYQATVEIDHHMAEPADIPEVPVHALPLDVLAYVYPSRYCQSDKLAYFAQKEFGHLPMGYTRAQAICQWVQRHVTFRSNTSNASTSALETMVERVGVCRDFAHLMIALCRACNMPARIVTGTDYGADPALGPPDFHAYVEVYLGHCWYLFDPSGTAIPMGMLRLATGHDAADVAFSTIFGCVLSEAPTIHIRAEHDEARNWQWPVHTHLALSTA